MKQIILFLSLFLFTFNVWAQEENIECANPDYEQLSEIQDYSFSTDPSIYQNAEPIVFNVFYWQVREPDGSYGGADFTEDKLLESIAALNIKFNDLNIFFKYRGYDGFDSPTGITEEIWNPVTRSCDELGQDSDGWGNISRCQRYDMWNYAVAQGYFNPDMINIYVPYGITDVGGAATSINKVLVSINKLTKPILYHELGHIFGLSHTNIGWTYDANTGSSNYPCVGCEHVTRNVDSPDYNANCRADRITDTNAVPDFYREDLQDLLDEGYSMQYALDNFVPFRYVDSQTCEYSGPGTDCINEEYQITSDDVRNIMLNTSPCEDRIFSPGQGVRMREHIEDHTIFETIKTDIASLYEPYKGYYPAYYPYPEPWQLPLFQPGFKYVFVACDGEYPQPAPYGVIFDYDLSNTLLYIDNDETNYSSIIHPNHSAIYLKHEFNGNSVFPIPEKCYNNYNSPPVIGGTIIKFNDNVLNANVTITQQDSATANDPQFISNLQPGLYNVIKNYNGGETHENLILKNNN